MGDFLSNHHIVINISARDNTSLIRINEVSKKRFNSISHNFDNQLVDGVANAYGSKASKFFHLILLGDKGEKGVVNIIKNFPPMKQELMKSKVTLPMWFQLR